MKWVLITAVILRAIMVGNDYNTLQGIDCTAPTRATEFILCNQDMGAVFVFGSITNFIILLIPYGIIRGIRSAIRKPKPAAAPVDVHSTR